MQRQWIGKLTLDSMITNESPQYVLGLGFGNCLSPEEVEYIQRKHQNIVLSDVPLDFREQDNALIFLGLMRESADNNQVSLQAIFDESGKEIDAIQRNIGKILERMENIF